MEGCVIDTNVAVVANGNMSPQATIQCVDSAQQLLSRCRQAVVFVDDCMEWFDEYNAYLSLKGQPGIGDAFFRWLFINLGNESVVRRVPITPTVVTGRHSYAEFPTDPRLESFDSSDRKWVAVALASGASPTIFNATDPDYTEHAEALRDNGVTVTELCRDCLA